MTVIYEDGTEEEGYHFRRDGTPYTGQWKDVVLEWAKDFENAEIRIVAQTTLPNKKFVSTVWTGTCQRLGMSDELEGPPLIFETMVFQSADDMTQLDVKLYSTEAEAMAGHEELCKQWGGDE